MIEVRKLDRVSAGIPPGLPVKVLQFGEGNFLRAFIDWMIHEMNKSGYNSGIAVVQPIENGMVQVLREQEGLYHHVLRGILKGKVIDEVCLNSSIQECINPFQSSDSYLRLGNIPDLEMVVSNTTEAGIQFIAEDRPGPGQLATTFPGKLTQLLKQRFDTFQGAPDKGLVFIPCELIAQNGDKLRETILQYIDHWDYGFSFTNWINGSCSFANTLVDRIVPGFPSDEINEIRERVKFDDSLVVASEVFHLMVIAGDERVRDVFPADRHGLNVKFVDDLGKYRTRKVRILNGTHTCMVPIGLLAGLDTVHAALEDEVAGTFITNLMYEEIGPTIQLPGEEVDQFAGEVLERFRNPFIKHRLIAISLNSISKFRVRVLPVIKDYYAAHSKWPDRLVFAFAALIRMYLIQDQFELKDDQFVLEFFQKTGNHPIAKVTEKVLSNTDFWDEDLTELDGLQELITDYLIQIDQGSDILDIISTMK